jgi:hypothetical protein
MPRPRTRRSHVSEHREALHQKQRDAIWKWRWLGLRESTPGFKGAVILLVAAAVYLAVRLLTSA